MVTVFLLLASRPAQAQVPCTPDTGYTTCQAYTYTGGDQSFTVPDGVTSLNVKVWGAGAGGSINEGINIGAPGGSGGYVEGILDVTPGSQYVIVTGEGGGADGTPGTSDRCDAAYGFGGACAPPRTTGGNYVDGGGGGGLSGLFAGSAAVSAADNGRAVFVGGGGGAGEGTNACESTSAAGGAGGNASAGTMPTMQGVHGVYDTTTPGINGSNPTGGGGGYLGGAGTDRLRNGTCLTSANGGSNFITGTGVSGAVNMAGNEAASVPDYDEKFPPETTDPQYITGVGVGQRTLGEPGGDGLVVLQWAEPLPVVTCTTNSALFNTAYDGDSGTLPAGSRDELWQVGLGDPSGPGSVSGWEPAYVVGQAAAVWTPSPYGDADYISFSDDGIHSGNVDMYLRAEFEIAAGVDLDRFQLGVDFYVDNSVHEIWINGAPQSGNVAGLPQSPSDPYFYGGFTSGNKASLVLADGWQHGPNEIIIRVPSGEPRAGLMAQFSPVPLCSVDIELTGGPCWRLLSSPVEGLTYADMLENLWTQGAAGSDYPGGEPNIFLWPDGQAGNDPADWQPLGDLNQVIPPGTGFLISVYADDDYDGVDDPFPKTLSVSGPAHTGDITPPVNTTPGGWTLVGNPYTQPVDFSALTTTELTDIGYVYDRNYGGADGGDTNGNTGGWRSTDGTYGDVTDGAFAPGQGFFVQNTDPATNPSVEFTEADQTTGGEFYGKQNEQDELINYIRLEVQGESLYNSVWIRFSGDGSVEPAYGDALELQPLSEQYALLGARKTDGTLVDIGHFPLPDEALEIPVHAEATQNGIYTITATDLDIPAGLSSEASAQAGTELYLHDLDTGEAVAITESFEYTFTISQAAAKSTPDQGITSCSAEPAKAKTTGGARFMITTSAGGPGGELPDEVALGQNYPNPFNPATQITYELPQTSEVHLEVFDMLGRRVAVLAEGTMQAGVHQVTFDAAHLTSGVYLYRLTAGGPQGGQQIFTKKLTLIK